MSDNLSSRLAAAAVEPVGPDWLDAARRARRISRRRSQRTALAVLAAALALSAAAPAAGISLGPFDTLSERLTTLVDGLGPDSVPREMELSYDPDTRLVQVRGEMTEDGVTAVRLSFQDGSPPRVTPGRSYDFQFEGDRLKKSAFLEGIDAEGTRVTATEIPPLLGGSGRGTTELFVGDLGYVKLRNPEDIGPGPFKFMEPIVFGVEYCLSHSSENGWNELRRC